MIRRSRPSQRRSAFTLVELLVVILIISILSALLTVAVSRGITVAKRTRNATEIRQLAAAVDAFKAKYKVDFIPSKLYLSESGTTYTTGAASSTPLVSGSYAYLLRIWPRLGSGTNPSTGAFNTPIDWNGSGKIETTGNMGDTLSNANGELTLQGDQVLVFFLGGIPRYSKGTAAIDDCQGPPSCTGFSKNPGNPAAHLVAGGAAAEPPLYEFDSSRLANFHNGSVRMFSYLDTYGAVDAAGKPIGMPYLYFSSYQTRNGYNSSDCSFFGVAPYAQSATQFLNPTGFQIISAGADQKFGPGTTGATSLWTPATAASSGASAGNGADDQSNFYDTLLGTPSIN